MTAIGSAPAFDERIETRSARVGIIGLGYAGLPLAMAFAEAGFEVVGIDRARNLMPKDPWRSMVLVRLEAEDQLRMPPLARNVVDREAAAVVRQWIAALHGKPALPPPVIDPPSGRSAAPVRVTLRDDDPEAAIRYTVDGSLPDSGSPAYREPLTIDSPLTLRAKAFRPGYSSSIVVNATFIVEAAKSR